LSTQALSVFDIRGEKRINYGSPELQSRLQDLANICQVDPEQFAAQFEDVHPRVNALSKNMGRTTKQNWKEIFDKLQKHNQTRQAHPVSLLRVALILYFVFGVSSSGVEQFFAKAGWGFHTRRLAAAHLTEEFCVKAIVDLPHHNLSKIIKIAQKVWSCCYGNSRQSGTTPRISSGTQYKTKSSAAQSAPLEEGMMADNETEFIRKRRQAAEEVAASSSNFESYKDLVDINPASASDTAGWSDAHNKELAFQREKLHHRKIQAVAEGVLRGEDDVKRDVKTFRRQRIKAQRARERKAERNESDLTGTTAKEAITEIGGNRLKAHIMPGQSSEDVLACMERFQIRREASICKADVFVVRAPGEVGQRGALVTAMRGAWHVSSDLLASRGTSGVASKWRRMACIPRTVFVSKGAHDRNNKTFEFLQQTLRNCEDSRIVLEFGNNWNDLTALQDKFKNNKSRLIAIVRTSEQELQVSYSVGVQTSVQSGGSLHRTKTFSFQGPGLVAKHRPSVRMSLVETGSVFVLNGVYSGYAGLQGDENAGHDAAKLCDRNDCCRPHQDGKWIAVAVVDGASDICWH
jgi:hypothetical protein